MGVEKKDMLALEKLNKDYANLIVQYRQAVMDYSEFLKNAKPEFKTVKGSSYWGNTSITQTNAPTIEKCIATCSSTKGCTGATYNAKDYKEPRCYIRGDSDSAPFSLSSGFKPNDVAIVDKGKYLAFNIDQIGKKLETISAKVKQLSTQQIGQISQAQTLQTEKLDAQYHSLNEERASLLAEANEHLTLENAQEETMLRVKQNHYWYILLFIVLLVVLWIAFQVGAMTGSSSDNNINPLSNIQRG